MTWSAPQGGDACIAIRHPPRRAGGARRRSRLRRNIKATGLIAERIEGRVGVRPGEQQPEDDGQRADRQAVIEFVVRAMVNARIVSGDDLSEDLASDRTPVIDAEVPR